MKQIVFDGRLGKDATINTSKNGNQYLKFSVANTSYSNGEEKTEWFDVVTFNDKLIKAKSSVLKKGSYVIISGTWDSDTSVRDNKVWLNHYVTASDINVPNLGSKPASPLAPSVAAPTVETPAITIPSVPTPSVEARLNAHDAVAANHVAVADDDDELPF